MSQRKSGGMDFFGHWTMLKVKCNRCHIKISRGNQEKTGNATSMNHIKSNASYIHFIHKKIRIISALCRIVVDYKRSWLYRLVGTSLDISQILIYFYYNLTLDDNSDKF